MLNEAVVDVKENQVKGLPMIERLFTKTAGSPECPSDSMSQPTIIAFYPHRILLANKPIVCRKCCYKATPSIRRYLITGCSRADCSFSELLSRFQAPFSPDTGDDFT
jgi:hypothetical protein